MPPINSIKFMNILFIHMRINFDSTLQQEKSCIKKLIYPKIGVMCENGMEFNACTAGVPETCYGGLETLNNEYLPDACMEGCQCPVGTVLHNSKLFHI